MKNRWLDNKPLTEDEKKYITDHGWAFAGDDYIYLPDDYDGCMASGISNIRYLIRRWKDMEQKDEAALLAKYAELHADPNVTYGHDWPSPCTIQEWYSPGRFGPEGAPVCEPTGWCQKKEPCSICGCESVILLQQDRHWGVGLLWLCERHERANERIQPERLNSETLNQNG